MRGYMANPRTAEFPPERKPEKFLTLALRGCKVPQELRQLAMRYEFSPDGLLPRG